MPGHILVLDPAPAMQALLAHNFAGAGYRVSCALDARGALALLAADPPDVLLLEWELPDASGIALLRQVRQDGVLCDLPIIMVSARNSEQDKVLALESGADDYLCKPFGPREMLARVHALLRRRAPSALRAGTAALRLDPHTLRVTAGNVPVNLGRVEFKLLHFLMNHPGRVHSRAQLLDQVWGHAAYLDERTVDAHVGRLRQALQPGGCGHRIETVRGSGYRYLAFDAAVCA
ncbi:MULTISPECIES: winged helix-turn-helix domain-containing protein [Janthinobacterium]|uniref:Winged helix-turn-helix domain-containing protein n=1 Tax=Janthinobacterium lividum TaxID=29581 RepID=A0AAJ4MVR6_9BURK|nr:MULTISPECIES: winged helix-turn-helix domain-containing protein [Janthinobacterium]KAB0331715.1 response regulator [Janthinobacterium lividum]QKY07826.1 response regulator [Janthinobacterium lividum]QSX97913.1 winged helix-turn-helix domain-containing protein [Janthinobacterium lividum]UGQ37880.1 winged helix-turn-helix domain-containing protein [Janthinobacterium sp. PLB04]